MFSFILSAGSVFSIDQYFKHKIRQDKHLPRPCCINPSSHAAQKLPGKLRHFLQNYVILRFSKNRGMFMNLLQNHPRFVSMLTSFLLIILSAFSVFYCRKKSSLLLKTGFGLLIGGAASNVYDRIRYGFVTDYISFKTQKRTYNVVYNLGDFAIFLSVLLIMMEEGFS